MFLVYEAWFFNFLQQLHHLCHICFWCFYCLFTDIQFGGNLLSKVKCDVLDNWHYGKQCFSVKFYATLARSWAMVNMCYCCRCQWFQCPLLPLLFYSLVVFELIKNYSLDSVSFSFFLSVNHCYYWSPAVLMIKSVRVEISCNHNYLTFRGPMTFTKIS